MTDVGESAVPAAVAARPDSRPDGTAAQRRDTPMREAAGAILVRELRGRMRGKKAFVFVTFYLSVLAVLTWLGLRTIDESQFISTLDQFALGRGIFAAVVLVEALVIVALAPPYTAGAISQERERQTFDLLSVTPVSSLSIVLGKLASGLAYLALLVGLSIPFASMAFVFGGVALETVVLAYLLLAVSAVGIGSLGIACSAALRRTQPATVAALLIVAGLVVGGTVGYAVLEGRAAAREQPSPPDAMLLLNPFLAEADLLCANTGTMCLSGLTVGGDAARRGDFVPQEELSAQAGGFWPRSIVAWVAFTIVMVAVATQTLRTPRLPRGPQRPQRSEAVG